MMSFFFLWFILCATNQHLPVYRDRGIPFFWVLGIQSGHCVQFGANTPMILCISHVLLLFLLLLQLCNFPSDSKVAPSGSVQADLLLTNLQAAAKQMIFSTCPNCQGLPAHLFLICSPDFSTCILTSIGFIVGGQEEQWLTSLMLNMPAESWIKLGIVT